MTMKSFLLAASLIAVGFSTAHAAPDPRLSCTMVCRKPANLTVQNFRPAKVCWTARTGSNWAVGQACFCVPPKLDKFGKPLDGGVPGWIACIWPQRI